LLHAFLGERRCRQARARPERSPRQDELRQAGKSENAVRLERAGLIVVGALTAARAAAQAPSCSATPTSMTPASWQAPTPASRASPASGLKLIREAELPGPANRFDYQSVDPSAGRIYMNHMNAGRTIVFDADSGRVIAEIMDVSRATGVRVVPSHHQVYISAA